mmetsp:Transcript_55510/g.176274  ORF Transcript_55510/g.176274 Transcript_55510/m.176274 type:complete len:236 (+) Transcript_55510:923-1630(+)
MERLCWQEEDPRLRRRRAASGGRVLPASAGQQLPPHPRDPPWRRPHARRGRHDPPPPQVGAQLAAGPQAASGLHSWRAGGGAAVGGTLPPPGRHVLLRDGAHDRPLRRLQGGRGYPCGAEGGHHRRPLRQSHPAHSPRRAGQPRILPPAAQARACQVDGALPHSQGCHHWKRPRGRGGVHRRGGAGRPRRHRRGAGRLWGPRDEAAQPLPRVAGAAHAPRPAEDRPRQLRPTLRG